MIDHSNWPLKWLVIWLVLGPCITSSGCRLCCEDGINNYGAYGGSWQRTRRDGGRVGSAFDPAGARTATLVGRDTPRPIDELKRERMQDSSTLEPDQADEKDEAKPDDAKSLDDTKTDDDEAAELKRRAKELRDLKLEDISTDPQQTAPLNVQ